MPIATKLGGRLKPTDLHPVEALLARQGRDLHAGDARQRFFGGAFHPLRPIRLPETGLVERTDMAAVRIELEAARRAMGAAHAAYRTAYAEFDAADTTIVQSRQYAALLESSVHIQRKLFRQRGGRRR